MAIDRATKVMVKFFSKSYGAKVHATLGILDLDPISKSEAYMFLIENPTYTEMFFGCADYERKCVLLTLMSRPKNFLKKMWDFLANFSFGMDYVILFCFGKTHYRNFFKKDICLHF